MWSDGLLECCEQVGVWVVWKCQNTLSGGNVKLMHVLCASVAQCTKCSANWTEAVVSTWILLPFRLFFHPLFIFVSVSLPPPLLFPVCWAGGLYSSSAPRNNLFCDCGCIYDQGWRSSQQGQGGHHHRSRCVCCIQLIQQIWGHIWILFLLVF